MIIQNMLGPPQAPAPEVRVPGDAAPKPPNTTVSQAAAAAPEPTPAQLRAAVDTINRALQPTSSNLQFSVDPQSQHVIVSVVDAESGEVIRQLPPKYAVAIAAEIDQELQGKKGLLLSQTA